MHLPASTFQRICYRRELQGMLHAEKLAIIMYAAQRSGCVRGQSEHSKSTEKSHGLNTGISNHAKHSLTGFMQMVPACSVMLCYVKSG